jgi:hypothetical protein
MNAAQIEAYETADAIFTMSPYYHLFNEAEHCGDLPYPDHTGRFTYPLIDGRIVTVDANGILTINN